MSKIIVYILILLFLYLVINHFILATKEGLESNCKTSSSEANGCKTIAVEKNGKAVAYTKKIMENTKKEILDLMDKVSKLIKSEEGQMNENTNNIKLNVKHVGQMNDAVKPD
jgi:hypothetical protein